MNFRKRTYVNYAEESEEVEERRIEKKPKTLEKVEWDVDRFNGFRLKREGDRIFPQFHCVWAK